MGTEEKIEAAFISRRRWLKKVAALAALGGLAACRDNDGEDGLDLGSGDGGLLNLLLALEQLQEAFFAAVLATPYTDMSGTEAAWLGDIQQHDAAHRELLAILAGGGALPALEFNLDYLDYTKRSPVLAAAKYIKDLSSSAYLSAMQRIAEPDTLALLSKMASVEARQAAWISDLITPGNFAGSDVVDANGFERVRRPYDILGLASAYIATPLNGKHLPV